MTDITELAQRARINAECGEHLSPAETMELVEALESKKRICATWRKTAKSTGEKLEKAQRYITELDREHQTFRIVGVRSVKASLRVENSKSRFIELWLRPGIFLPHKRPEHSMSYYAGMAVLTGTKAEIY
ncbi:hypothetical protein CF020_11225 [Klebsiella pneumoniae]|nr:hypothetical protein [Klebsiella pneumoniae]